MDKNKLTPQDLLNQDDFSGIILSKKLLKRLGIEKHPFLKISMENEIMSKGEVIRADLLPCLVHENGWGFISLDGK